MFKVLLKDTFNKQFLIKLYIILVIFCFFSGQKLSISQLNKLTLPEYVVLMMSEHYYLIYFMIIAFIFLIIGNLKDDNCLLYIRNKHFISYFISKNIVNLIISVGFVLIHTSLSFLIGLFKLNLLNEFTTTASTETMYIYSNYFDTPIFSIICLSLYMILGLFFISFIIEFINHFFKKNITIACVILLYLFMILSLNNRIDNNNFYFLHLNNYFILHHAIVRGQTLSLFLIQFTIITLITLFMKKNWWLKYSRICKKKVFF